MRDELGQLTHGPAAIELVDNIDQVSVGVDSQDQAAADEREGRGQTFTTAHRAGEQKTATCATAKGLIRRSVRPL